MINKLALNIIYIIALFSLSGSVFAENYLSDSSKLKINPLVNKQIAINQSELSTLKKVDTSTTKSMSQDSAQNRSKNNEINFENFNSVPVEWYSVY